MRLRNPEIINQRCNPAGRSPHNSPDRNVRDLVPGTTRFISYRVILQGVDP